MSLFRSFSAISRRVPDHLQVISDRIYVFDSCLSATIKTEKECKTYLAEVVKSLQRFHPGASVMVFNFREGEQMSLLSDILINYDIVVVDYPRHYEGYPLLPLEMVHCFLRSSDSWLSLEGQKNVILMHCESGGWPLLAFMLAGLLLYRKQFSGEQKTLDLVYKQAPKKLLSPALSLVNPQGSQLRYLQYITQRDLTSEWPPSDAPVIVDCLMLRNLPLLDGGKGCRPVVRVYGQDPSAKNSRGGAQILFSSLMEDVPVLKYSKEECVFVKLELQCKIQGDVFLECIHLHDDLVTEEIMFKVMFHTGFVQSNQLSLESVEIDVPWNVKLPKDFKAEALFRDMNEVTEHITMNEVTDDITMELGGGGEFHDSDNEFFEVEEILIPMPASKEVKDLDTIIIPEMKLLDNKNKDCTLHNGSPRWDLDTKEVDMISSQKVAPEEEYHQEVLETKSDKMNTSSKSTEEGNYLVSEPESDQMSTSSKNIDLEDIDAISPKQAGLEKGNYLVSELEYDKMSTSSRNICVEDFDDISSKHSGLDEENYTVSEPESDMLSMSSKNIDFEESYVGSAKQISLNEGDYLVSEAKTDRMSTSSQKIDVEEIDFMSSKQVDFDEGIYLVSGLESDKMSISSKTIHIEDFDDISSKQFGLDEGSNLFSEPGSDKLSTSSKNIKFEETDVISAKQNGLDEGNHLVSEPGSENLSTSSKSIEFEENDVISAKQTGLIEGNHLVSEPGSNNLSTSSKNIEFEENDVLSAKQTGLVEGSHLFSEPGSDKLSTSSKNIEFEENDVISAKQTGLVEGNQPGSDKLSTSSKNIEFEENDAIFAKQTGLVEGNCLVSEPGSDKLSISSKINEFEENDVISAKHTGLDEGNYLVLEPEFDKLSTSSKNIDFEKTGAMYAREIGLNEGNCQNLSTSSINIGVEENDVISSKIAPTAEGNCQQVSEEKFDVMTTSAKSTDVEEVGVISTKCIAPEKRNNQEVSKQESDITNTSSKNIVVVDSYGSEIQDVKVEIEPKPIVPIPAKPKFELANKKNKWQEIAAKTIKQQRVISQWVPRAKTPEVIKPKAPVYKWVAKGPIAPTEGAGGE